MKELCMSKIEDMPGWILYHGSLEKWQHEKATIPLLPLASLEDLSVSNIDYVEQNAVSPAQYDIKESIYNEAR